MAQSVSFTFKADSESAIKSINALRDALKAAQEQAGALGEALKTALSAVKESLGGGPASTLKESAKELRAAVSEFSKVQASHGHAGAAGAAAPSAASIGAWSAAFDVVADAARAAGKALLDLAQDAVSRAIRAESINTRFQSLASARGEGAQAAPTIARAHAFANATGYGDDAQILSEITQLMRAGMDVSSAQTAVEQAHRASLGDDQDFGTIFSALQRAAAKGGLDNLASLGKTGLPLKDALGEVLGLDPAALQEAAKQGGIGADALVAALQRVNAAMGATAEAVENTTQHKLKRLENIWGDVLTGFGLPILDLIKPAIDAAQRALVEFGPTLQRWGESLAEWGAESAVWLSSAGEAVAPFFDAMRQVARENWDTLVETFQAVLTNFRIMEPVLAAAGKALGTLMVALAKFQSLVLQFLSALPRGIAAAGEAFGLVPQQSPFDAYVPPQQQKKAAAAPPEDKDFIAAAKERAAAAEAEADAAKAQEEAAKAAKKAAEDAKRAAIEAEKAAKAAAEQEARRAKAQADSDLKLAILDAKLAGDNETAHSLELAASANTMASTLISAGIDPEEARRRAAEITAKEQAVRLGAGSSSDSSYGAEAGEVIRTSATSGTMALTLLKSPMEAQTQHLADIQEITQSILDAMTTYTPATTAVLG